MAYIQGVGSAFPEFTMDQENLLNMFKHEVFGYDEDTLRRVRKVLESSNISTRPTCVNMEQFVRDLDEDKCPCTIVRPSPDNLFRGADVPFQPTLTNRAKIWEESVKSLALEAARKVLTTTGTTPDKVECVITNTSSGVVLPNLDIWLAHRLQLTNLRSHYSLDNTGCGGAITCLDFARSQILAGRAENVLVVTVDCCSPHMNTSKGIAMEAILPNMLFGDGAGAIFISKDAKPGSWEVTEPKIVILGQDTESYIDLQLTETGYLLKLSKDLVSTLERSVSDTWSSLLSSYLQQPDPQRIEWLIHPGGKSILDVFTRQSPPLTEHDMRHSVEIMQNRGNLVSCTLVFVLERMFQDHQNSEACMIGPGPGVEIKFLKLCKQS